MQRLNTLLEKYVKTVSYSGGDFLVFENPDVQDIKDILVDPPFENTNEKSIRFGFTKNGNMYAWHYACLHNDMEKRLGKTFYVKAVMEWSPHLFFSVSPETFSMHTEQVEPKYLRMRLAKAFPEAKHIIDEFIAQLDAASALDHDYRHADKMGMRDSVVPCMARLQEALDEYDMWEAGPMDRKSLIDWLRDKGLLGPFQGSNHAFMKAPKTGRKVTVPNDHGEVYSRGLISQISRQANFALAGA